MFSISKNVWLIISDLITIAFEAHFLHSIYYNQGSFNYNSDNYHLSLNNLTLPYVPLLIALFLLIKKADKISEDLAGSKYVYYPFTVNSIKR